MEQWEKEYIDTINQINRAKGKAVDCSYEEGYDSSRWIEIKNVDGTRYYVPKKFAFDNQRKKNYKRKTRRVLLQYNCILKVLIGIALGLLLLRGFLINYEPNKLQDLELAKISHPISLQGVIQGKLLGGTYINGYGFADMMHFFKEVQQERHLFLDEIAENINSLSEVNATEWSRIMALREQEMEKLKYANSYQQYVDTEKRVFEQQKELLTLIKHQSDVNIILEMYNRLAGADMTLRSEIVKALEKNGIDYYENQDGLTYWYKNY